MSGCNCHQCRARMDARFWAIVSGVTFEPEPVVPMADRIKWYTDAPRARSAEEFDRWLNQIVTRAKRREDR